MNPQILIHLGLPKTATTSLQWNVFQVLHNEKKINFLGKAIHGPRANDELETENYSGRFIMDYVEGRISLQEAKRLLENIITHRILNVWSDESFLINFRNPISLEDKFDRLSALLEDFDVSCVVTLRNPRQFFTSLYYELHPDLFYLQKYVNTEKKMVDLFINNPNHIYFQPYFYDAWVPLLRQRFNTHVLRFEDLREQPQNYWEFWQRTLGLPSERLNNLFNSMPRNVRSKTQKHELKKFFMLDYFAVKISKRLRSLGFLFWLVRFLYLKSGMVRLFRLRIPSPLSYQPVVFEENSDLDEILYSKEYENLSKS